MAYIGWLLPEDARAKLLRDRPFLPHYAKVMAHHVTLRYPATIDDLLPTETSGEIIGVSDDNAGVQAVVVRIGGATRRPDGSIYHITWSLGTGRRPVESNDVIQRYGWSLVSPILIPLEPTFFPN